MQTSLRSLLFVVFLMALSVCARAASSPLIGARLTVLRNGLRFVHREHRSAPLVAIDLWIRAGSSRETAAESGAAHFLEHLLFKGTPTRKPGEIDAAIEDLGATLSAGTTRDGAHFYTTVAAEHTAVALEVIADAVRNAAIDPGEMERERAVLLDEMAQSSNDGRKQVTNQLYEKLYPGHPMGRPVLGQAESLRGITRSTVWEFYRRWYVPNNVTLVLVGDIDASTADALVAKLFGDWQKQELPADSVPAPVQSSADKPRLTQQGAWIGSAVRHVAAEGLEPDPGMVAVGRITARVLADGDSGRIAEAIHVTTEADKPPVKRRPTIGIVIPAAPPLRGLISEYSPHRGGGALKVTALCAGDAAAAVKAIEQALAGLSREAPTAEELDNARRREGGAFLFQIETYAGQARALGEADVLGDYRIAVDMVDRLSRVTAEDVSGFARRNVIPAQVVAAIASVKASP